MKRWDKFISIVDGYLAFVLTLIGVLVSGYLPQLQSGEPIDIKLGIGRIVLGAVVALGITFYQESRGSNDLDKEAQKRGKRKNLSWRMFLALMQGLFWPNILKTIEGILSIGGG